MSEQNQTKDESDINKPSECKIPKTELDENETPPSDAEVIVGTSEHKHKGEDVEVKVIYNKKKYDVKTTSETTISEFKKQLQDLIGKKNIIITNHDLDDMK